MPTTDRAGLAHSRDVSVPLPISRTPSSTPASARSRSSERSSGSAAPRDRPATATSPRSSCSVASSRASAVSASGTGPPYAPLCTACRRVRTSTTTLTPPRRVVVRAGTPTRQLIESASTRTSPPRRSPCLARSAGRVGDPISSSPSTRTVTPTPGSLPSARSAAQCNAMPALSSAAPRPYNRPSRSTGSNGSVSHSAEVSHRLHVVVGVEQHRGRAGRTGPAPDHGRQATLR